MNWLLGIDEGSDLNERGTALTNVSVSAHPSVYVRSNGIVGDILVAAVEFTW